MCSIVHLVIIRSSSHAIAHPVLPAPERLANWHKHDVTHAPNSDALALFTRPPLVLRAASNLSAANWDTSCLAARFVRAPPMFNAVASLITSASMSGSWRVADAALLPEPLAFFVGAANCSEFEAGALRFFGDAFFFGDGSLADSCCSSRLGRSVKTQGSVCTNRR